ncbi:MAG TPA: hypothetical protein VKZ63_10950 [Kofleriaceae bacterium]|nr:hypothetical protein [Kofleriaceae bacterium]
MRFPLDERLIDEAARFRLRSACSHCRYQLRDGSCVLGWPNRDQRRWPLDAPDEDGRVPAEVHFCKEFELA